MSLISFGDGKKAEWDSGKVYEPLKNIVRCIACQFDGIIITCLVRDFSSNKDVGGVKGSKHIPQNCYHRLCGACDFVLDNQRIEPERVIRWVDEHFLGCKIIYHDAGSGNHFHIQADPPQHTFIDMT